MTMAKSPPVRLWCQACQEAYESRGEVPTLCPRPHCRRVPNWTTTPPFKLTVNDTRFLRSIRITQE